MSKINFKWLIILFFAFISTARADVLYLNNGRTIEGIIKSQDEDSLLLDIGYGTVKFVNDQIRKIYRSSEIENDALRQKWEGEKIRTENSLLKERIEEEHKPRKVGFSSSTHGIIVDAMLDGKEDVSLVLDTGAALVVLRKNIADKLGINLRDKRPDIILTLADGRRVSAKRIFLKSVTVERVEAKNVEAAVLLNDEGGIEFDGLLGMSFLKNFKFKVDYQ